jgi:hypothetical protein
MSQERKLFTVTTICHITGREADYKLSFSDEESLIRWFAGKPDKLIAVSDGWKTTNHTDIFPLEPYVPHYWKDPSRKPDKPYDYREESLEFDFC